MHSLSIQQYFFSLEIRKITFVKNNYHQTPMFKNIQKKLQDKQAKIQNPLNNKSRSLILNPIILTQAQILILILILFMSIKLIYIYMQESPSPESIKKQFSKVIESYDSLFQIHGELSITMKSFEKGEILIGTYSTNQISQEFKDFKNLIDTSEDLYLSIKKANPEQITVNQHHFLVLNVLKPRVDKEPLILKLVLPLERIEISPEQFILEVKRLKGLLKEKQKVKENKPLKPSSHVKQKRKESQKRSKLTLTSFQKDEIHEYQDEDLIAWRKLERVKSKQIARHLKEASQICYNRQGIESGHLLEMIHHPLNHITEIDLSHNLINSEGMVILTTAYLENLKTLYILHNLIESLVNWTPKNMPILQKLNADHNKISKVAQNFKDLINLKIIILDSNQLTEIPKIFFKMPHLEDIWIVGNKIDIYSSEYLRLQDQFLLAGISFQGG